MRTTTLLLPIAALLILTGMAPAAEADATAVDGGTADLRGFGRVAIDRHRADPHEDGGSWTTLTAADEAHAAVCAAKYLADATALGRVAPVADGSLAGTNLAADGIGAWLLGLDGARFHVLFAPTRAALSARARRVGAASWRAVPDRAYPPWLDCFDNAAVGFWVLGGGVLPKDLDADLRWFAENRFTMCATGVDETRLVAPGVLDTTLLDWYAAKARALRVPYRMLLGWSATTRPAWVRDVVPLPHIPPADAPSVTMPVFDRQDMAGEIAQEPVEATDAWMLDARRRIAAHAAQDPWFSGHHVSAELAGSSVLALEKVAALPETARAWRAYLRDTLRLDLAAVGMRHVGRADAYARWDDVPVPQAKVFAGWDPATCVDLRGRWDGHADAERAGEAAGWFDAKRDPGGWTPVDCNDAMLLLYARDWDANGNPPYWLKRRFTVAALDERAPRFIHISRPWWHGPRNRMRVWVNGVAAKDLTGTNAVASEVDQCFDVGDALVAGENRIVVDTRGCPIASYIFASPTGHRLYPAFPEPMNRLWFDACEFAPRLRGAALENAMAATRHGDRDRPMKVMAPAEHADAIVDLFARWGAYPHDTGQSGACWAPWTTSAILARGVQHSSEPGNPAGSARELRDFFTYYLMLGDDAVDIVFHADRYRTTPELADWIARNRSLIGCIGKIEHAQPRVAVLRSNRTTRLGIDRPYLWDLTRGELQAVGRAGQLVDLPDVAAGFADAYPVLFDDATEVMTEADVDALIGYVERGGTFIALHCTGMHSPGRANAWPISRLTGMRVKQDAPIGGKHVVFPADCALFPGLAGKSVDGWGLMLDWTGRDVTGDARSLDGQVEAVARWQDDLGIAIGRRRLGKGQVITLGSTFWRDARDVDRAFRADPTKQAYLDQLLTAVGAPRESATTLPAVWAETWRSKNGIFDVYPVVCMRATPAEPVTGDIALARTSAPSAVWEVSQPGAPAYDARFVDGHLVLPAVRVEPMLPRVFAAPRADVRDAAAHWFAVQRRQWSAITADKPIAAPPAAPEAEVVPLVDGWRASTAGDAGDAWHGDPAASAAWPLERLGTFAAMGHAEDARVRCFRRERLPAAWAGQRVRLVFDAPAWFWGLQPLARLWVGGRPLSPFAGVAINADDPVIHPGPDASFSADVTDRVHDGALDVALEIDGALPAGADRPRPSGVTGVLFLRAEPTPVAEQPLTAWWAGTDVGVVKPVAVGERCRFTYLETRFALPQPWPAPRVFLRAPAVGMHVLVVNNIVVRVPPSQDRLDVSKLLRAHGENVVRWLPLGSLPGWPAYPRSDGLADRAVPELHLLWWR